MKCITSIIKIEFFSYTFEGNKYPMDVINTVKNLLDLSRYLDYQNEICNNLRNDYDNVWYDYNMLMKQQSNIQEEINYNQHIYPNNLEQLYIDYETTYYDLNYAGNTIHNISNEINLVCYNINTGIDNYNQLYQYLQSIGYPIDLVIKCSRYNDKIKGYSNEITEYTNILKETHDIKERTKYKLHINSITKKLDDNRKYINDLLETIKEMILSCQ